jgi:hypothetical protein
MTFTQDDLNLICDALEELYDNLQYNDIDNNELILQQKRISKLVSKILLTEVV